MKCMHTSPSDRYVCVHFMSMHACVYRVSESLTHFTAWSRMSILTPYTHRVSCTFMCVCIGFQKMCVCIS